MLNLIKEYEIIIAVLIAVIGWFASHLLNVKAEKEMLLYQIYNESRKELVESLGQYQSWLLELSFPIHSKVRLIDIGVGSWNDLSVELRGILERYKGEWIYALENYEILFPETKIVRQELVARSIEITDYISDIFRTISSPTGFDLAKLILMTREKVDFIEDQSALVEDIKIHLQNKTLHSITKNSIPTRTPLDTSLPRIVLVDGMLAIVDGTDVS